MPKQDIDIIDDPDMILDDIGEEFEVEVSEIDSIFDGCSGTL